MPFSRCLGCSNEYSNNYGCLPFCSRDWSIKMYMLVECHCYTSKVYTVTLDSELSLVNLIMAWQEFRCSMISLSDLGRYCQMTKVSSMYHLKKRGVL